MLRIWLREFWEFLIEPWVSALVMIILAILMGLLLRFNFYLGGWAEEKETAVWQSLVLVPEPAACALCEDMRYHAPCLVNLVTGKVDELQIYDPDLECEGEIAEEQESKLVHYFAVAGTWVHRDTNNHTCTVTLPEEAVRIDGTYFCRDCRAKLTEVATEGYVLADLYDLENVRVYAVTSGVEYNIREYTVSVTTEEDSENLTVHVAGNA